MVLYRLDDDAIVMAVGEDCPNRADWGHHQAGQHPDISQLKLHLPYLEPPSRAGHPSLP